MFHTCGNKELKFYFLNYFVLTSSTIALQPSFNIGCLKEQTKHRQIEYRPKAHYCKFQITSMGMKKRSFKHMTTVNLCFLSVPI